MNYYNDNDPAACAWIRELIEAGLIPAGEVDDRPIEHIRADELAGFTQCHFFAGIAGWPLALQLAGWPADRAVWTGSCPCQPFSGAGKGLGTDDPRHLWPAFYKLINECRPATVFGEQVASPAGREWLAGVFADLETSRYAVAGAGLPAAGVGAPHIRQRLWWVASGGPNQAGRGIACGCGCGRLGVSDSDGREPGQLATEGTRYGRAIESTGGDCGLGNPDIAGLAQRECDRRVSREACGTPTGESIERAGHANAWSEHIWLPCLDGKARRIKPGIEPLAHGVSGRVGLLRGYGNAIVPEVAARFVQAFLETERGL